MRGVHDVHSTRDLRSVRLRAHSSTLEDGWKGRYGADGRICRSGDRSVNATEADTPADGIGTSTTDTGHERVVAVQRTLSDTISTLSGSTAPGHR